MKGVVWQIRHILVTPMPYQPVMLPNSWQLVR